MIYQLRKYKYRMLFIWIGMIYFIIYKYWPMYGLAIAFQDYRLGHGFLDGPWVGFKHFKLFFENPDFVQTLWNTIIISVYRMVFGFFPPIVLAILLNEVRQMWFKRWVQTLTYIPHFLSWVIVYGIFYIFLSQGSGLLNQLIKGVGGKAIPFMQSSDWFRSVLVVSDLWKDLGWGTIIYLAALAGISPSLYEAAIVDGANKWRQILNITLPGIAPVMVLLFILRLGHILDAGMEQILVFYNPLVYSVSDIIDTWAYRTGILEGRFSLATAVGLFKSFIGLILVCGADRIAKRFGQSGVW